MDRMNGVLHALVRRARRVWPPAMPSVERKLQVGGNVLTLFVVQLVIMIWKPGI